MCCRLATTSDAAWGTSFCSHFQQLVTKQAVRHCFRLCDIAQKRSSSTVKLAQISYVGLQLVSAVRRLGMGFAREQT